MRDGFSPDEWEGIELFSRYALSPHSLGYCGGPDDGLWEHVAQGKRDVPSQDIREAAKRFSGAWAYMHVLSQLTGFSPFALDIGRTYWREESCLKVSNEEFGEALLAYIRPQAESYWQHLTEELLPEARPTHSFHVLSVYPWSHLLSATLAGTCANASSTTQVHKLSGPQVKVPMQVLSNCVMSPGKIVAIGGITSTEESTTTASLSLERTSLTVEISQICLDLTTPHSGPLTHHSTYIDVPIEQCVGESDSLQIGVSVITHWGWIVEKTTPEHSQSLLASQSRSLELTNKRMRAQCNKD